MATDVRARSDLAEKADALHRSAIVIDAMFGEANTAVGVTEPPDEMGGLTAAVITLAGPRAHHDLTYTIREIVRQMDYIDFYADRLLLVRSVEDIQRAKNERKLGLVFNFQGISPIGTDLTLVRAYHELGVRSMQLTYMEHSLAGSGCFEREDRGLTSFGRQLIRAMERVGILLDLSHVGRRTSLDALAFAKRPVVFSHCNPAALFDVPRNITDEEIRACASTGGIVGLTPTCNRIAPKTAPRPTISDFVDHIVYVADLVGVDHVGVASDVIQANTPFLAGTHWSRDMVDGIEERGSVALKEVAGVETKDGFSKVTLELMQRGFSDEDILKVLGGNWMRVFRSAWLPQPARADGTGRLYMTL